MSEQSPLTAPWTSDDLLSHDPLRSHNPRELSIVWTQLHHHLYVNNERVVAAFCAVVRREQSTAAKMVALRLAGNATGALAMLIDELVVEDRLLYAHYRGSKLIAVAISARWGLLDANQRAAVMSNIEASHAVSPTFADARALIAAIPSRDRSPSLEARLIELGGPRVLEAPEFVVREGVEEPQVAPRSLAERMADLPAWLEADPIQWGKISSALLDDERGQAVEAKDRPARLLTSDVARRIANAAIEAMEEFVRTPDVREDVVHAADVAAAFPPHHKDDALNTRLVEALRTRVFAPPLDVEVASHALMFVRPWHWRRDCGRELLLAVIRDSEEPNIVVAALHPLWHAEEKAIVQAFQLLTDPTKTAQGEEVGREMGKLLGAGAPWLPALSELLLLWLSNPPTGRFLASNTAWNEFLGGVGFALKNEAHRAPKLDPLLYSQLASALWEAWQSPRSKASGARHGLALFLMSPIHRAERDEIVAQRYWSHLRSLFEKILATGDEEDVSGALFSFDLTALPQPAIEELASILRATAGNPRPIAPGRDNRDRIAQTLRDIALVDSCFRATASEIHQTLVSMGARKEALDVERRWKSRR